MTLRHYTRHRKPIGPQAQVTIPEEQTPPSKSSPAAGGNADPAKTAAANFARPGVVESILRAASPIGPGIQLRCPGFLSNSRQHRMFGLASLELAQLVRGHWDSIKAGGAGTMLPDAGSSTWQPRSAGDKIPGGAGAGRHPVGFRDLFDVAVRWRQLSEPNDPVWWIDRLTPSAFREGFGLQTPMVNGQLKVTDAVVSYRTDGRCLCRLRSGRRLRICVIIVWYHSVLDRALLRVCRQDECRNQVRCLLIWQCNAMTSRNLVPGI